LTTLTYTKEKAKALAVDDDVPSNSMKEIQRKDSKALDAEDDVPASLLFEFNEQFHAESKPEGVVEFRWSLNHKGNGSSGA